VPDAQGKEHPITFPVFNTYVTIHPTLCRGLPKIFPLARSVYDLNRSIFYLRYVKTTSAKRKEIEIVVYKDPRSREQLAQDETMNPREYMVSVSHLKMALDTSMVEIDHDLEAYAEQLAIVDEFVNDGLMEAIIDENNLIMY
jgi:hypothetical protein